MYRGLLRNEHVTVRRPKRSSDGAGGSVVDVGGGTLVCERYFCRIYRSRAETTRVDRGQTEDTTWSYVGDSNVDIRTGDVFFRGDGTRFVVTRSWRDLNGRVRSHAQGRLRRSGN